MRERVCVRECVCACVCVRVCEGSFCLFISTRRLSSKSSLNSIHKQKVFCSLLRLPAETTCAPTHTRMHCLHTRTHTYMHTRTHTRTHTHTLTHIHAHTHTHTYTHTHTHTHTHTQRHTSLFFAATFGRFSIDNCWLNCEFLWFTLFPPQKEIQ